LQPRNRAKPQETALVEELFECPRKYLLVHGHGNPHVRPADHHSSLEMLRRHPDNGETLAVHQHVLPYYSGIAAKFPLPEAVADDNHRAGSKLALLREESASLSCLYTQNFKIIC